MTRRAAAPPTVGTGRAPALDGRRRVRHRLQRLRVDGDRAAPRGGRGDELARAGRAGSRRGPLRPAGGAGRRATPMRSPTTASPRSYRHCRLLDHGRGDWAMTIARRYLYDTADAVRLEALVGGSWAPLAELVGEAPPRGALPPDARRRPGSTGWHGPRASRATGCSPRSTTLGPGCRHGLHATPRRAGAGRSRDPGCADDRARGALARSRSRRRSRRSTSRCRRPPAIRRAAGLDHGEAVPLVVGRVHLRPAGRSRSDLVSEAGVHDRRRARTVGRGRRVRAAPLDEAAVRAALGRGHGPGAPDASRSSISGSSTT